MSPGRNDPCPCGSGKKYKKCCWAKDEAKHAAELASRAAAQPAPTAPEDPKQRGRRSGFKGGAAKPSGDAPKPRSAPTPKGTNLPRRGAV
jgi:hypothetical protein